MNEIELLRQFRDSRSESAFAALVHACTNLVYSVAKRRAADVHLAEDITQLVFIRLARNPPQVETHPEFLGWLHRTTVNVAIDMWRADNRRKRREEQTASMQTTTPGWNAISLDLDDALDRLPEEDRQALLLRFLNAKSMREVGAAFGVSEDAGKMRVSRALERLRSQLGVSNSTCTTAALGALLLQNSVEAAPPHVVSQLLKINVAALSSQALPGSLLSRVVGAPSTKLAAGFILAAGLACLFWFWPGTRDLSEIAEAATTPLSAAPTENRSPTASVNGALPQSLPMETGENIRFRLQVVEDGSRVPLPKTKIKYMYFGPSGEIESRETVTDESGGAVILKPEDPHKTGPNVFVSADWHVPKAIAIGRKRVDGVYTVALERAREISGWVLDAENNPLPEVTIHVQTPGREPGQLEARDFQTCPISTRADGSWSCTYIPFDYTNEIRLILKKSGFAITFPVIPVSHVELTKLVLVMDRGFTIEGQVTDLQGIPLRQARIRTLNGNSNERKSAQTDDTGRFSLSGVSPYGRSVSRSVTRPVATNTSGAFVIRGPAVARSADTKSFEADLAVQAECFASQVVTVRLEAQTNVVQIPLAPGNVLRGVVRDEAGNPVAGAFVRTDMNFAEQIQTQFEWSTRTDASGRFEWNSAPAEPACYWFAADGYKSVRGLSLTANGTEHTVTLKQGTE